MGASQPGGGRRSSLAPCHVARRQWQIARPERWPCKLCDEDMAGISLHDSPLRFFKYYLFPPGAPPLGNVECREPGEHSQHRPVVCSRHISTESNTLYS